MMLTFMPAMAFADDEPEAPDFTKLTVECLDYSSSNNTVNLSDIGDPQSIDIFTPESASIKVSPSVLDTKSDGSAVYYDYTATIPTDAQNPWGNSGSIKIHDSNEAPHSFATIVSDNYDTRYHSDDINGMHGFYSWGNRNGRPQKSKSPIQIGLDEIIKSADGKIKKTLDIKMPVPANSNDEPSDASVDLIFDFNNVEIFNFGTNPVASDNPDPDDVLLWSRDGVMYDCNAKDEGGQPLVKENNSNKLSWALMRAEELSKDINTNVATYGAVDGAMAAAEQAIKTPGDAAVAAAQSAVDAVQAAKGAQNALSELIVDESAKFINSAYDFADGKGEEDLDQKLKEKAESNFNNLVDAYDIVYRDPSNLEEAEKVAKANLTQAKSENAEVKAEAAAAEAAALRYTPVKTKIKSIKPAKKKATVSFKKLSNNVTGYEIQIVEKKSGAVVKTVNVGKSKKKVIKKTVKGLKKKTKYKAKVRAYHTVNGQTYYGAWSKAKSFKTTK